MSPTPIRSIRVPDELWDAVKQKAYIERVDVAALVVKFLEDYASKPADE